MSLLFFNIFFTFESQKYLLEPFFYQTDFVKVIDDVISLTIRYTNLFFHFVFSNDFELSIRLFVQLPQKLVRHSLYFRNEGYKDIFNKVTSERICVFEYLIW